MALTSAAALAMMLTTNTFAETNTQQQNTNSNQQNTNNNQQNKNKSATAPATAETFSGNYSLQFDPNANYTLQAIQVHGRVIIVRAYENVVYVAHPQDPTYESMNIYIPQAYFYGQEINGYTVDTAPIFMPNAIGGYMPATPMQLGGMQVNTTDPTEVKFPPPPRPGKQHAKGQPGQQPATQAQQGQQPPADGQQPPADGQQGQKPADANAQQGQKPADAKHGQRPADAKHGQRPADANQGPRHGAKGQPPMPQRGERRQGEDRTAAMKEALAKGMIVVSPGARGRTLEAQDGSYYGKAPAAIVDLKAAVRYLHANDKVMPGDANKIIANGTSAGGALSALLGATGNQQAYEPYLKQLGAADASDAIFAVSAYAPITNLDHADAAYEWLFNGVNNYKAIKVSMLDYNVQRTYTNGTLTEEQQKVSDQLKALFPEYLNSLNLKANGTNLTLDSNGNGSFKQYVADKLKESAQRAYDAHPRHFHVAEYPWLTLKGGKVTSVDLDKYAQWVERQKTPPAFDGLDLSTGENNLFGNAKTNNQHFTKYAYDNSKVSSSMADPEVVKMMNPMYYIDSSNKPGVAEYWRIRHGSLDKDTSLAIPTMLALKLENNGYDVNFQFAWNTPHSGDYDLPQLFAWIENITKPQDQLKRPEKLENRPEPQGPEAGAPGAPAPAGDQGQAPAQAPATSEGN
ncbi:hypothetical protein CJP74_00975 [Psittacicella melopsittaci]|uniref:BD-FAE-like domain-containing protein n=2 Tax=Psittacicella melopsittaci TaxID=2028576 RepID=A0A3A1Y670_9GAMM|nr:hypothetical protein CJP74_00975 [Psittacicella melopsittaci]